MIQSSPVVQEIEFCPTCAKRPELCFCATLKKLDSRLQILILQHPQEPDKDLGTAKLAQLSLPRATLRVGLSWANLSKALGRETQSPRWAVLYLGSGIQGDASNPLRSKGPLQYVTNKGAPMAAPDQKLEGIVIIDGTWSQAKTIWWRNAWLLKLKRVVLVPQYKSLYRELRKEPRRECLSTIESIALCLDALGEPKTTGDGLREVFETLLGKFREWKKPARRDSARGVRFDKPAVLSTVASEAAPVGEAPGPQPTLM